MILSHIEIIETFFVVNHCFSLFPFTSTRAVETATRHPLIISFEQEELGIYFAEEPHRLRN